MKNLLSYHYYYFNGVNLHSLLGYCNKQLRLILDFRHLDELIWIYYSFIIG